MQDKPSSEFFRSLGQYVYAYIDPPTSNWLYVGKGNHDRCWHHVSDKEFDPDHCYIIARNLEQFHKPDWQSHLLETFLIKTKSPSHNKVAGHYSENITMVALSSMFADFVSDQHDNFESFPSWYLDNYDVFRGRLREVKINSGSFYVLSNARNAIYMSWYTYGNNTEDPIKVVIEINPGSDGDARRLNLKKDTLVEWLNKCGYDEVSGDANAKKLNVEVPDVESAIRLFEEFVK